ncbi:MAG: hypothetical protein H6Q52_218 [Deltaproteobacteria bacterium]|nr:hypothetical protein [Deltaproteobacteria bacterium]
MRTYAAGIAVLFVFAVLFIRAPNYLVYSDKPQKADVVVLFLGSEYKERRAEAVRLIRDGYADYLLIPAYGKMAQAQDFGRASRSSVPSRPSHYPVVYEDTHIEVLEAKRLMDKEGLTSAIFVSSPYHMRRIRLIANRVFTGTGYRTIFVPTRFEKPTESLWFLHQKNIRKVASEYSKIAWFFLYRWLK